MIAFTAPIAALTMPAKKPITVLTIALMPSRNHSNLLYAATKATTSYATPAAIRLNGLSAMAMLVTTMAAATAPMAAAIAKNAFGLS